MSLASLISFRKPAKKLAIAEYNLPPAPLSINTLKNNSTTLNLSSVKDAANYLVSSPFTLDEDLFQDIEENVIKKYFKIGQDSRELETNLRILYKEIRAGISSYDSRAIRYISERMSEKAKIIQSAYDKQPSKYTREANSLFESLRPLSDFNNLNRPRNSEGIHARERPSFFKRAISFFSF